MQHATDEGTQEKQNETDKEGQAGPQAGLTGSGEPALSTAPFQPPLGSFLFSPRGLRGGGPPPPGKTAQ